MHAFMMPVVFLVEHFEIDPGYVYGLFQNNSFTMSSAGKERGYM